jgi:flagellar basal-body rod protein FlgB
MPARLTESIDFHGSALMLRAERQKVLAGNIANADTPGFSARDFDFKAALADATGMKYRNPEQPSLDGNSVDLDRERANFADNALRYEAALRFINGSVRNLLSAIRGD